VVIAGSLPAGISVQDFLELIKVGRDTGSRIAIDTSGPALHAAIECGVDVIKPNHHELAEILGVEIPDMAARIDAAGNLQRESVPHVILSMGPEGAIFATPDGTFVAKAPPVDVISTVGAGDSMLAGYIAGLISGLHPIERACLASVFSWCAIEQVPRRLCPLSELAERMRNIIVTAIP
jgi:1-phosphofructokinase